ncbi:MAG TPA: hypothetical protein VF629_22480, partial [Hymenobacter sp.]
MKSQEWVRVFCQLLIGMGVVGKSGLRAQTRLEMLRSVKAPGVVPVQDSLFMDEAEISNLHWIEYLHFLRKDSSQAFYQSQMPDTTALSHWLRTRTSKDSIDNLYGRYYLRYPGFRHFPVVGITHQQAINYCHWRTATVKKVSLESAN